MYLSENQLLQLSMKLEYVFVNKYNEFKQLTCKELVIMIFGYMRISTKDKQTTDRQELTLRKYAEMNGFVFNDFISENVSGNIKANNRAEYLELKDKMRNGIYC